MKDSDNRTHLYKELIKPRQYLWWWVPEKDKVNLSLESVVQRILADGDIDDVKALFKHIGHDETKMIFLDQVSRPRHNYRPQTVNFFKKVFSCNV